MKTNPSTTPTNTPTTADVQTLADAIARDGISAHDDGLIAIADVAAQAGLYEAAVEVVRTASSADVVRARAFLVLARNWPEIAAEVAATDSQQRAFTRAFRTLACRWEHHRKLRQAKTPHIDDLWRSRTRLEAARAEAAMLRSPR